MRRPVGKVGRFAAAVGVLVCITAAGAGRRSPCLDELQRMCPEQLEALFAAAEPGAPPVGLARGRLLSLTDRRMPGAKVAVANALWRGKEAAPDGYFVNRWAGGVKALDSHYVLGSSWLDGRPAYVFEYPPGTPLFGNMRDEFREIAPGLYLGRMSARCPCPTFRGYLALQMEPCR